MEEKRRRRGRELSPQLMSPGLSVMAAEGERERERGSEQVRIDWCSLLSSLLNQ